MIANARKTLNNAFLNHYAIGHFNVYNLESAVSVILAAESKNAPVFLATTETSLEYAGFDYLSCIVKLVAQKSKVPIIIHLDHSTDKKIIEKTIHSGYNSVMFDGSKLELRENIKQTKSIADISHRFGIICEGELGIVGNSDQNDKINNLTNPDNALEFVKATCVDSLAVAIGNKHGMPKMKEKIDFDRLKTIKKKLEMPLVYHGASSTSPFVIKKLIKNGINKINIDTDLRYGFTRGLEQYLNNHREEIDPRKILKFASLKIQKTVESKIEVFGSAGKA